MMLLLTLRRVLVSGCALLLCSSLATADTYTARDTLGPLHDDRAAAARLLERVYWEATSFELTVGPSELADEGDAVVRYPSPLPSGNSRMDTVAMLWFKARDASGELLDEPAPAVVLIHSMHGRLLFSKTIARAFSRQGLHAFIMQMPGYGERSEPGMSGVVAVFENASQAAADARRARDAVAVLPQVADGPIALQATSLGGFIASVAASLDDAFNPVMLALTGGNGWDVLHKGDRDALAARRRLAEYGYTGDTLRERLDLMEPLHVAHRLDPDRTWLYSGRHDTVIPPANADALAEAIGLDESHHRRLNADHYSAILQLPVLIQEMVQLVRNADR
ncbi:alpha/beta hydrolase family protein [Phycisphaerales bacterium AB-hyl4]|uniref:Alpha/beta hydrolase family protein n=1 Tax=Natronomicrosphaera hydrolytica TaxID=3242702 RepID=A0ABV4U9I6_9BACT